MKKKKKKKKKRRRKEEEEKEKKKNEMMKKRKKKKKKKKRRRGRKGEEKGDVDEEEEEEEEWVPKTVRTLFIFNFTLLTAINASVSVKFGSSSNWQGKPSTSSKYSAIYKKILEAFEINRQVGRVLWYSI